MRDQLVLRCGDTSSLPLLHSVDLPWAFRLDGRHDSFGRRALVPDDRSNIIAVTRVPDD